MKKHLLLFATIFYLLLGNVFSQTVYKTKTGKKYHLENCGYLSKSKIEISLSDAMAQGLTACSKCNPPSKTENTPKSTQTAPQQQNTAPTTPKSTQSTQCTATTKAGTRCKRMTKSPNGLCFQHGGQ